MLICHYHIDVVGVISFVPFLRQVFGVVGFVCYFVGFVCYFGCSCREATSLPMESIRAFFRAFFRSGWFLVVSLNIVSVGPER